MTQPLSLNWQKQLPTVLLLTKETPKTQPVLVDIFLTMEHVANYLAVTYGAECNDAYPDLFAYGKYTFPKGDTIRIQHYQLHTYQEDYYDK